MTPSPNDPTGRWFIYVTLRDLPAGPLACSSDRHGAQRNAYFSEDVDPYFDSEDAVRLVVETLNAHNPYAYLVYHAVQIAGVIPARNEE